MRIKWANPCTVSRIVSGIQSALVIIIIFHDAFPEPKTSPGTWMILKKHLLHGWMDEMFPGKRSIAVPQKWIEVNSCASIAVPPSPRGKRLVIPGFKALSASKGVRYLNSSPPSVALSLTSCVLPNTCLLMVWGETHDYLGGMMCGLNIIWR